jgi:hypothetical protein
MCKDQSLPAGADQFWQMVHKWFLGKKNTNIMINLETDKLPESETLPETKRTRTWVGNKRDNFARLCRSKPDDDAYKLYVMGKAYWDGNEGKLKLVGELEAAKAAYQQGRAKHNEEFWDIKEGLIILTDLAAKIDQNYALQNYGFSSTAVLPPKPVARQNDGKGHGKKEKGKNKAGPSA